MKKIILFIIFILLCVMYFTQRRSFYYLPEINTYVTVWKKLGGTCYVIIDNNKYYLPFTPKEDQNVSFFTTSNVDIVTIVYSPSCNYKFYINTSYENNRTSVYSLKSYQLSLYSFEKYKLFDSLFYYPQVKTNPLKIKDEFKDITINIRESYAVQNNKII